MKRVKIILGTSSSRIQQPIAAYTRAQSLTRRGPCATCNWLLHPAPTSAQDGLDPLQLALVVFFLLSISAKPQLHLQWASPATCDGGVFLIPTSTFTNVHAWLTTMLQPPLQLALVVVSLLPTKHLLIWTHAHEHVLRIALCGSGCMWWWFYLVLSVVCVCACMWCVCVCCL